MKFFKKRSVSSREKSQYLKIICRGDRFDFIELIHNATKVHSIIQKSSKRLILLDFTEIFFYLPQSQSYNLLKVFEQKLTYFKEVKMAALISPQSEDIANFWSAICHDRDFEYEIFRNEELAIEWLLN